MFTMIVHLVTSLLVCVIAAIVVAFVSTKLCGVDRVMYGLFAGFVSFLIVLLVNAANVDFWILDELFVTVTYSLGSSRESVRGETAE